MSEFRYIWEYTVEPDNLPKFLSAYQPDGDWAQLFRRDDAYLGTELLKDRRMPYRFVTIDRWQSYSSYAVFRERYKDEFDKLDAHCETLTTSEKHLGDFEWSESVGLRAGRCLCICAIRRKASVPWSQPTFGGGTMLRILRWRTATTMLIILVLGAPTLGLAQWGGSHVPGSVSLNKNGNDSLGESFLINVQGDVVASGVGLRGVGEGSLVIDGIPAGATVEQALLYWATLGNNTFTSPTLDGMSVSGVLIGTGLDTCWGATNNFAYRADVTSIVDGNGTYEIAGLPSSGPSIDDSQGASLVVIYRDGTSSQRGLVIHDGAATIDVINGPNSYTHDIESFVPGVGADAHVTYLVGDGQSTFASGSIEFEGVTLSSNAAVGANGDFWDTLTYDVSAHTSTPPATTTFLGSNDCLLWVATIFSVEGSVDGEIFADGFESGTTSAWSSSVP